MFSNMFPDQSGFNVTKHVVIVGGGFAECAAAMVIKKIDNSIRITIIERSVDVFMDDIDDQNGRLYIEHSLSPYITSSLKHLNLWQCFLSCHFLSDKKISETAKNNLCGSKSYSENTRRKASHISLIGFIQSLHIDYVSGLHLNKLTQSAKKTWLLDFSDIHDTEYTIEADFIIDDNKQHALDLSHLSDQQHAHHSLINIHDFFRLATKKNLQFVQFEL